MRNIQWQQNKMIQKSTGLLPVLIPMPTAREKKKKAFATLTLYM